MVVLGRETEAGPASHLVGLRGGVGSTFVGSSESIQLCWVSVKGCHVWGLTAGSIRVAYVEWHRKRTCCVYQAFLAGCTSIRIAVTLRYE
jgi:hypothetical protein